MFGTEESPSPPPTLRLYPTMQGLFFVFFCAGAPALCRTPFGLPGISPYVRPKARRGRQPLPPTDGRLIRAGAISVISHSPPTDPHGPPTDPHGPPHGPHGPHGRRAHCRRRFLRINN